MSSTATSPFQLDRSLLPDAAPDPLGAVQVGLALGGTLFVVVAAVSGWVPVHIGGPVVWGVVLLSIIVLHGMRTRRAAQAWSNWSSSFERHLPAVAKAAGALEQGEQAQAGEQFDSELLRGAHRIPGLPAGKDTHLPHGARLLRWVASRVDHEVPAFAGALTELAERCAERDNCCDA